MSKAHIGPLFFLMLLLIAGGGVASFFAGSREAASRFETQPASQGQTQSASRDEGEIQPFTLRRLHVLNDANLGEMLRYEEVVARDSQGNTASSAQSFFEGFEGSRVIEDVVAGKRIQIDPLSESTVTTNLADPALRQAVKDAQCRHTNEQREILGVSVFRVVETLAAGGGAEFQSDRWIAPDLGCIVMSEGSAGVADGTPVSSRFTESISLELGEPSSELFAIPPTYVERSPSQLMPERIRRHPWLCDYGACDVPGIYDHLDEGYYRNRNR